MQTQATPNYFVRLWIRGKTRQVAEILNAYIGQIVRGSINLFKETIERL